MVNEAARAPDAATLMRLAQAAVACLPDAFREHLQDVVIRVEEFADKETLRELGIDSEWELTGLYQGRPVSEQSIWSSGELPPTISLFRAPLLNECVETGVSLEDLVNHVIVHEVGHHFGLSDDEMHAIEKDLP
jgi:predicted Zn-dependent protease with MMP-like domain